MNGMESLICHLEPMAPQGPGNPFNYDAYHMGQKMGKDHYIMFPNHNTEELRYMVLIDTRTGNKVKIVLHG
jgi:hypothetical protein